MLFWLNTQHQGRSRSKLYNHSSNSAKKAFSQINAIINKSDPEFQSSFERESDINDTNLNNNRKIPNLAPSFHSTRTNSNNRLKPNKTEIIQRMNTKQKEEQKSSKDAKTDQLRQLFNKYDEDQDGMLSIIEFQNLMYKGKQQTTLQTSNLIFNQIKSLGNTSITFQDFFQILSRQDYSCDSQKSLREAFADFDKKNKGYFQYQDYLMVCQRLEQKIDKNELKQAFMSMDSDGNGKVTFEEFKRTISS